MIELVKAVKSTSTDYLLYPPSQKSIRLPLPANLVIELVKAVKSTSTDYLLYPPSQKSIRLPLPANLVIELVKAAKSTSTYYLLNPPSKKSNRSPLLATLVLDSIGLLRTSSHGLGCFQLHSTLDDPPVLRAKRIHFFLRHFFLETPNSRSETLLVEEGGVRSKEDGWEWWSDLNVVRTRTILDVEDVVRLRTHLEVEDVVRTRTHLEVEDVVRTRTILDVERYNNSFNGVWAYCSPQLEINGSFGSPLKHSQRFLTSIINSSLQHPIPNVLCSFMRITPHLVRPRKNKDGLQEPQGGTVAIPRPPGSRMVGRKHTGGDRMRQQVGRTSPSRAPLGGNTWMVIPTWKSFTSVFKWQDLDDIECANKVGLQPVFSTNWTRVVPRKKLLKEFVVGVRVLGPERIVVLIRGRELIYTAENIAQILRFPHISPDATPTPMVNLSQQE